MNDTPVGVVTKNLGHASTLMIEKHYGHLAPSFVADQTRKYAPDFDLGENESNVVPIASAL